MIVIYHALACSYYEALVTALEFCRLSPHLMLLRFSRGLDFCRMSYISVFVPLCYKGFVRALEACRMSPYFVFVGFGERLDNYQISDSFVFVLRGTSDYPRALSYIAPISYSCDLVGA